MGRLNRAFGMIRQSIWDGKAVPLRQQDWVSDKIKLACTQDEGTAMVRTDNLSEKESLNEWIREKNVKAREGIYVWMP